MKNNTNTKRSIFLVVALAMIVGMFFFGAAQATNDPDPLEHYTLKPIALKCQTVWQQQNELNDGKLPTDFLVLEAEGNNPNIDFTSVQKGTIIYLYVPK